MQKRFRSYQIYIKKSNASGFTLAEMLVSVFILVVAVGAPLTAAVRGITLAQTSRHRTEATFLAQEGLEAIRNIRDTNVQIRVQQNRAGGPVNHKWDEGFGSGANCHIGNAADKGCTLSVFTAAGYTLNLAASTNKCTGPSSGMCPDTSSCGKVRYVEVGTQRKYGHNLSGGTVRDSIFQRVVRVRNIVPGEEVRVEVIVEWDEKGQCNRVTAEDHLFDWSPF